MLNTINKEHSRTKPLQVLKYKHKDQMQYMHTFRKSS